MKDAASLNKVTAAPESIIIPVGSPTRVAADEIARHFLVDLPEVCLKTRPWFSGFYSQLHARDPCVSVLHLWHHTWLKQSLAMWFSLLLPHLRQVGL